MINRHNLEKVRDNLAHPILFCIFAIINVNVKNVSLHVDTEKMY